MELLACGYLAAHCDHQAQGELGDGDGVGARGVHDHDAVAGSGIGVDVIDADTGAADDSELRCVLQQGGVGLNRGSHNQGIGVRQLLSQRAVDLVGGDDLPTRFLLQDVKGRSRDFLSENNFHWCFDLTVRRRRRGPPLPTSSKYLK